MIAYNNSQYQTRNQSDEIIITNSQAQHVDQMMDLFATTYNVSKSESYSAEQFLSQISAFPEGQFVALDADTGRVVGLTISMRVSYEPECPLLDSWVETTNYG